MWKCYNKVWNCNVSMCLSIPISWFMCILPCVIYDICFVDVIFWFSSVYVLKRFFAFSMWTWLWRLPFIFWMLTSFWCIYIFKCMLGTWFQVELCKWNGIVINLIFVWILLQFYFTNYHLQIQFLNLNFYLYICEHLNTPWIPFLSWISTY